MKKCTIIALTMATSLFLGCSSENESETTKDNLTIYFTNHTTSQYSITGIEVTPRGYAGENAASSLDSWEQILKAGDTVHPGDVRTFVLPIKNLDGWAFSPRVHDDSLGSIYLRNQYDSVGNGEAIIEHWGSDQRTVTLELLKMNGYVIMNYSSWAGTE